MRWITVIAVLAMLIVPTVGRTTCTPASMLHVSAQAEHDCCPRPAADTPATPDHHDASCVAHCQLLHSSDVTTPAPFVVLHGWSLVAPIHLHAVIRTLDPATPPPRA